MAILLIALGSCAAQKAVNSDDKTPDNISKTTYEQALDALDEQKFTIKIAEFHFPSGKESVIFATHSYISMLGNYGTIRFSPDLAPRSPMDHLNAEDNAAEITKGKRKKNGDMFYCMKIYGTHPWQRNKILITLYKNSNKCFIQIKGTRLEATILSIKGYVYPLKEDE